MKKSMKKTLIVKNLSGSFNEKGIGHEIINYYDFNNNNKDYYLFYLPPYGSIGRKDDSFVESKIYRNGFEKIVVFDSTGISYVYKLKAVVLKPIIVESIDELNRIASQAKYGTKNKVLNSIDFKDDLLLNEDGKEAKIFSFTYKVNKNSYYKFDEDNIFVWIPQTKKSKELYDKSEEHFKYIFGKHKLYKLAKTRIGEKNFCYDSVCNDFEEWYTKYVEPKLNKEHKYVLKEISNTHSSGFIYDENNILEHIGKLYDENLYTNFIAYILNKNKELLNYFISFLVLKCFNKNNYVANNAIIETQKKTNLDIYKKINIYLDSKNKKKDRKDAEEALKNMYGLTKKEINKKGKIVYGQVDMYLADDNYRFVIENKILSGINGKHKDIEKDINQLTIYKDYLNDMDMAINKTRTKPKTNKVVLLVPKNVENRFKNYDKDVPVITYYDLSEFFNSYENLIGKYKNDFLNALYKHSYTREEEIKLRFNNALNN